MCYSAEVKAAVIAALLQGQSVTKAATTYKIPRGTVAGWSASIDRRNQTDPNTKKEIGDLLIRLVKAQLESAIVRVKLFGDKAWLETQTASELYLLHGVDIDKAVLLLEAFDGGEEEPDTASRPSPVPVPLAPTAG